MNEVENVYETVDEKEYTKKVLSRQEDDWIVDDGELFALILMKKEVMCVKELILTSECVFE